MTTSNLYIGLISGTSADAIDAALVDFSGDFPQLLCAHDAPWGELQADIHRLCSPGDDEIPRMAALDHLIGERFAAAANQLLQKAGVPSSRIAAIGSHGQTVRHLPPTPGSAGFSVQIGDPNIIAEQTGITTVADFRRRDMAAGGQGAPLVPAFHQAAFEHAGSARVVVNIGGLANITALPGDGRVAGHDTGPGNTLMDAWIQKHLGKTYDENGQWAATGAVQQTLLERMFEESYFKAAPPKSTGRELFNLAWLERFLDAEQQPIAAADVQATLLELTAQTIAADVRRERPDQVFVCGGGAYNARLMQRLSTLLTPARVSGTQDLGIAPEWIEAAAFAWLAMRTVNRLPGNAPQATGADSAVILGGIYPA